MIDPKNISDKDVGKELVYFKGKRAHVRRKGVLKGWNLLHLLVEVRISYGRKTLTQVDPQLAFWPAEIMDEPAMIEIDECIA